MCVASFTVASWALWFGGLSFFDSAKSMPGVRNDSWRWLGDMYWMLPALRL